MSKKPNWTITEPRDFKQLVSYQDNHQPWANTYSYDIVENQTLSHWTSKVIPVKMT